MVNAGYRPCFIMIALPTPARLFEPLVKKPRLKPYPRLRRCLESLTTLDVAGESPSYWPTPF